MKLKAILALAFSILCAALQAQELASLPDMLADYHGNPLAADSKYVGKAFALSVKVSSIEKDANGDYYIAPAAAKKVRCYFMLDQRAQLSAVKKGDDVDLHGICKGFDREKGANHLVFSECRFGLVDVVPDAGSPASEIKKSLFILKGSKGSGSGFAASIGGVSYIVSNFHVFEGNDDLKLVDCDNREVVPKSIKFAPDRDIALFELPDQKAYAPLAVQPEISSVSIGSIVRNYGNSAGGGVFTELSGKVLGVGPLVIEVDAPFVGGNSGSPVVAYPSMKVLGVATYATFERGNWVMAGTRFANSIRRYATRIDNIDPSTLETFDKAKFDAEAKLIRSLEDLLMLKASLLSNLKGVGSGNVSWADFQLYAGKIPDSSKKLRLTQLAQQWNKELANLEVSRPDSSASGFNSNPNSSKAIMEKAGGHSSGLGLKDGSTASIQKIPYDDLDRLLFVGDPKPAFAYKRLQERADIIAKASEDMRKNFKSSYENIKALLRN